MAETRKSTPKNPAPDTQESPAAPADSTTASNPDDKAAIKKETPSKKEATPLTDAERVQRDHDIAQKGN